MATEECFWLGLRGSCFRLATGPIHCTPAVYEPVFNDTFSTFIDVANSPLMCARARVTELTSQGHAAIRRQAAAVGHRLVARTALLCAGAARPRADRGALPATRRADRVHRFLPADHPLARHGDPGRRLLPRPHGVIGVAKADGRLSGALRTASIALTWQDGYNDAVAQIAPTPTLNVAHAGSVYAMLFSATSFSAVTYATRAATSLTPQVARRGALLPRLHAAGARLPTGTAEEPVQLEAMTATLGARLCPWVYVRSSVPPHARLRLSLIPRAHVPRSLQPRSLVAPSSPGLGPCSIV